MPVISGRQWIASFTLIFISTVTAPLIAQDTNPLSGVGPEDENLRRDIVQYPAEFFDKYHPNNALDMVEQLPGFRVNDGGSQRGFGGTSGNILIDGRRPATKQDQPSDILGRIPADQVVRIEIIRGAVREIELQGQVEVANVILRVDAPASIRWETVISRNFEMDTIPFQGNISMSDQWHTVEYNVGFELERFARLDSGTETEFDALNNFLEGTDDLGIDKGWQLNGNMNATTWIGNTQIHLNTELGFETGDDEFSSFPLVAGSTSNTASELQFEERDEYQMELGIDMERDLFDEITGRLILIYIREDETAAESQRRFDLSGNIDQIRFKDTDTLESEAIIRTEFIYSGWPGHSPQLSLEGAYNLLDNAEDETSDAGGGPVDVFIPGADTRVEETRGDFLIHDTWSIESLELEYGLGAEASRIEQSGDENLKRNFFFLKPYTMLSYSPSDLKQTRMRIERKVSQLDFEDFVSTTVFEDDELALGNPNLRPETSWVAQLSHEHRFGELGVVKLTAFYHWISDVQDLLPLTETEEVPGNIGHGRRWGMLFESTLPLDWIGLDAARLDIEAYWQDSSVTDPVTGDSRVLSGLGGEYYDDELVGTDIEYEISVDFRQDFESQRFAWGWKTSIDADRTRFKVNELDVRGDEVNLNVFMEATRWFGLKFRVEAKNLLNAEETRERLQYSGLRGLSAISGIERQAYIEGREIELSISGSF